MSAMRPGGRESLQHDTGRLTPPSHGVRAGSHKKTRCCRCSDRPAVYCVVSRRYRKTSCRQECSKGSRRQNCKAPRRPDRAGDVPSSCFPFSYERCRLGNIAMRPPRRCAFAV